MILFKRCALSALLLLAVLLLPDVFPLDSHAASSVYIPGIPSATSSAIGISCNYNGLGAGTMYCTNQSPGPTVTCSAGVCTSSAGYQNRLMLVTPGSYNWTIPASTTKVKVVVIGSGGNGSFTTGVGGGSGGGYAEKTIATSGGTNVTVTVQSGGTTAATSITVGGTTVTATGGQNGSNGGGGCGSGGDVNTCGGLGDNTGTGAAGGGGGAGGPFANGGTGFCSTGGGGFGNGLTTCPYDTSSGQYGGYAFGSSNVNGVQPLGINNSLFWTPSDIQGNGGQVAANAVCMDAGLGGGGASANCCSAGGFGGGGGGHLGQSGLGSCNGGIGGGGGGNGGKGGQGIAIIYW